MAYIVACIEFDDNYNLKNVNIVDDESMVTDINEKLETLIGNKKNTFCIKISVINCSSNDPDCFMLSNDKYFKLDFENFVPTAYHFLSDAFLNGPDANVSGSNANVSGSNANVSGLNANVSNSFDDFKAHIIQELTDAINKPVTTTKINEFKGRIIQELTDAINKPMNTTKINEFKKRILEELTKTLTTP